MWTEFFFLVSNDIGIHFDEDKIETKIDHLQSGRWMDALG
jgi:hypothetical protein